MLRSIISICLSLLFVALLAVQTIITFIDDSIDISCFYASGEEEEKSSEKNEKNKEKDILCLEFDLLETNFASLESNNNLEYFLKKYSKPHLNLISPPPELHI